MNNKNDENNDSSYSKRTLVRKSRSLCNKNASDSKKRFRFQEDGSASISVPRQRFRFGFGSQNSAPVRFRFHFFVEPPNSTCRAYTTCRQELSVLLTAGSHPNIVLLVCLCTRPLSLVLYYGSMRSLQSISKEYERTNVQLELKIYQKLIIRV